MRLALLALSIFLAAPPAAAQAALRFGLEQVEHAEAEEPAEPWSRILAVAYCPALSGEPSDVEEGAVRCTAAVGGVLAWHDFDQGRVSLVGAMGLDSVAFGVGWSWREGGVPVGLAVGVALPYDGDGVYLDGAALVVGVSASVMQLLGRGGGDG